MAKYRALAAAKGPRDTWMVEEDKTASVGNSLQFEFCQGMGVSGMALDCWSQGNILVLTSRPPSGVVPDHPAVNEERGVAAA